MTELRFFVTGIPSPGGSKSAFCLKKDGVYTGRAVVVDAGGEKTKQWRQAVAATAFTAMQNANRAPLTGAIEFEMIFQMPRPKSHYRSDGVTLRPGAPSYHVIRPDCLKLARSTEDAMSAICYSDDCQIVKETIEKFYSDQVGAWIVIRELRQN
jgi:Holliday junction resolvase RusA-like endonuclease